jgi:Zn-dependent M28 family amino/carboxypeptidase
VEAEVVDVGRGTTEDFDRVKSELKGRIALVRHEYPFAPGTIHRRIKYIRSRDEGAVGFMIANNLPDAGLVTGSSGMGEPHDIPAVGIGYGSAGALAGGRPRVRLDVHAERGRTQAANLVIDVPGREPEWVLLTAHYDGHDLAESALDNGTGAAAVIRIVELLARHGAGFRRGLRAILFTTEEWRLLGSQIYVDELGEAERRRIAMVVNLDTLAGSPRLSCLTSEFDDLDRFVDEVARAVGCELPVVPGLLRNSDHYNFARHGIPAMRLVAGFGEVNAQARYLLTSADTRDKVEPAELLAATRLAAELVWAALHHPGPMPRHKTVEEMRPLL